MISFFSIFNFDQPRQYSWPVFNWGDTFVTLFKNISKGFVSGNWLCDFVFSISLNTSFWVPWLTSFQGFLLFHAKGVSRILFLVFGYVIRSDRFSLPLFFFLSYWPAFFLVCWHVFLLIFCHLLWVFLRAHVLCIRLFILARAQPKHILKLTASGLVIPDQSLRQAYHHMNSTTWTIILLLHSFNEKA